MSDLAAILSELFDHNMLAFLLACACFGAAWGCFVLVARNAPGRRQRLVKK